MWQTHKPELVKYMYNLKLWAEEETVWIAENLEVVWTLSEE
jgi:hypothetical protein